MDFGFKRLNYSSSSHLKTWMSQLPDETNINRLLIPGTCHSGRYKRTPLFSYFQSSQENTICQQLQSGIRFLDIRAQQNREKLVIENGRFNPKTDFQETLNSCYTFLKSNPNECIYLSLKEDLNAHRPIQDFQTTFINYLYKNESDFPVKQYWYTDETGLPSKVKPNFMDEVRGKIILLRKFQGVIGVNWNSSQLAAQENVKPPKGKKLVSTFPTIKPVYLSKWNTVLSYFNYSVNDSNGYKLFINFASIYNQWKPNAKKSAATINGYIQDYLTAYKPYNIAGIIVMDFPSQHVLSSIINLTLQRHGAQEISKQKVCG